MSEEEIMQKAKDFILFMDDVIENYLDYDYEENKTAYEDKILVQGLLDLYNKEKEKNKELEAKRIWNKVRIEELKKELVQVKERYEDLNWYFENQKDNFISKDKIKEKIEELEKKDKIIDLMAEHIEDNLTDDICNKEPCYADEYINGHCQKCLDCIKQYFEKKAEESK